MWIVLFAELFSPIHLGNASVVSYETFAMEIMFIVDIITAV